MTEGIGVKEGSRDIIKIKETEQQPVNIQEKKEVKLNSPMPKANTAQGK